MPEIIPNFHPILVHFTVAWLTSATLFFLILLLMRRFLSEKLRYQIEVVAGWSLWPGMGVTLATVAAGFYAYNTVTHDAPSHTAMTKHRNWAIATVIVFIAADHLVNGCRWGKKKVPVFHL